MLSISLSLSKLGCVVRFALLFSLLLLIPAPLPLAEVAAPASPWLRNLLNTWDFRLEPRLGGIGTDSPSSSPLQLLIPEERELLVFDISRPPSSTFIGVFLING